VSGLIGGLALYALYTNMSPYLSSHIDNPEFRGLYINQSLFKIVGVLLILAFFTWTVVGRSGLQIYLYVALPIAVLVSSYYVTLEQRIRLVPDVYDKAGIFTKHYLSADDVSKVLIVGSEPGSLFRSLFYLDNPNAALEAIPRGSVYDISKLSPGKEWVLVIGDQVLPETTYFQLPMNGFTLARAIGSNKIDFRKTRWPGFVSRVRGLSHAEPWGTWSSSDLVSFEFFRPLPEKFEVTLSANSFGPNAGKEFVADVDGSSSRFVLTGRGVEKVTLDFDNPNRSKILSIRIPYPTSPKSLGMNGDDRNLGIGLVELTIVSK
jgi:phosphoglycerol transferase